jgi:D-amino-acid dehydrogenase
MAAAAPSRGVVGKLGTVICGGGVGGIAASYILSKEFPSSGVTLFDPLPGPCQLSSAGLSGVLTPYHTKPRTPDVLLKSLLSTGNSASASEMYISHALLSSSLPSTLTWGLRAIDALGTRRKIGKCFDGAFALSIESISELRRVADEENISLYDGTDASQGVLNVFETEKDVEAERRAVEDCNYTHGYNLAMLTRAECIEREPALERTKVMGGSLAPTEFVSEAAAFAEELVEKMRARPGGVDFKFKSRVTSITGNVITVAEGGGGGEERAYECERIVLCNSLDAGKLMRKQVIEPVWGYSVTFDNTQGLCRNLGSLYYVTEGGKRRLFSRFKGNRIRLAGLGDIGAPSESVARERLAFLKDVKEMGADVEFANCDDWCGYRPLTPDANPLLGRSATNEFVFYNTGLGNVGWIQSFGCALRLKEGLQTGRWAEEFSPGRFGL